MQQPPLDASTNTEEATGFFMPPVVIKYTRTTTGKVSHEIRVQSNATTLDADNAIHILQYAIDKLAEELPE